MVSVKYQNQIVTTLNPYFKENDSILQAGNKELAKTPALAVRKTEVQPKVTEHKTGSNPVKPKEPTKKKTVAKPRETKKPEKKPTAAKPKKKATVKIE